MTVTLTGTNIYSFQTLVGNISSLQNETIDNSDKLNPEIKLDEKKNDTVDKIDKLNSENKENERNNDLSKK